MIDVLRPYTEHQSSEVSWLGAIPAHWERAHGGAVLQKKKVSNRGMIETTVLSLSYGRIVIKPPEKLHGLVPESFETYQVVDPGDIIIRPTDLQNDWNTIRVGIVRDRGIITSAYLCFRVREPLTPDYAHLLLLGYDLKKVFYGMGSGLRQNLDWSDFKRLSVLAPPREEQEAIVRYVGWLDRNVRRFIRNRRRLIEVLNEQKQAIIDRAVTRGLDPGVSLKPSGVDWLGDIPEHWEVKPLKRWALINELVLPEFTDPEYAFDYLDIGCVGTGVLVGRPSRVLFRDAPSRARRIVRTGDTIISTVRTYLRAIYFVDKEVDDLIASTGFAVLTPRPSVVPEFLGITLQSGPFVNRVTANSIGIAYPAIAETRLGRLHLAIPPSVEEQSAIVAEVRSETEVLAKGINRAQREIELIREYRTRLIADVVTGKVDVRHLAPPPGSEDLEEAIDELEPLDDAAGELEDEALAGEVAHADD